MEIAKLVKGDIFEVIRNGQQYEFVRRSINIRPRDFLAKNIKTDKETWINLQTKIKAIKLVSDGVQDWFFTFGFGQPHKDCYHKITATKDSAEHAMNARFGKNWSMMYSAKEFDGQIETYNLKEIK